MSAKRRSQEIQYADRILGALNHVESLRLNACSGHDFGPSSEKAANIWRMAQAMEEAIIRENKLPDIDALLEKIFCKAETFTGEIGNGYRAHSYIKSAFALWEICFLLRRSMTPMLRLLLDLVSADGHFWEYTPDCCPTKAMLEPKQTETSDVKTDGGAA